MILVIYGTRPEYIKIRPLLKQFREESILYKTLFTGQHKDLLDAELTEIDKADYVIDISPSLGNRLNDVVKSCLSTPEHVFQGITHILVQGDTSSVVGLALNGLHRKIPVIHLEAGLRTNDYNNPYPEENNRRIVSTIAQIHLCPTSLNYRNLEEENILGNKFIVGNTVLDEMLEYRKNMEYQDKILVTLHRRENHDKMDKWFKELEDLALYHQDLKFILPIHPNPNVTKHRHILKRVNVIEPLSRDSLLELLSKCKMVITDSGGIQEECSFLNKKCLVCRETTERPEVLGLSSFIVKSPDNLFDLFNTHLNDYKIEIESPYGDGKASEKICKILKNYGV